MSDRDGFSALMSSARNLTGGNDVITSENYTNWRHMWLSNEPHYGVSVHVYVLFTLVVIERRTGGRPEIICGRELLCLGDSPRVRTHYASKSRNQICLRTMVWTERTFNCQVVPTILRYRKSFIAVPKCNGRLVVVISPERPVAVLKPMKFDNSNVQSTSNQRRDRT